jgi:hypothetical protein
MTGKAVYETGDLVWRKRSCQQTLELRFWGFTQCDSAHSANSPEFLLIG